MLARPIVSFVALFVVATTLSAQETIRSKATVNFTFDEDAGPVKDSATVGQSAEEGKLVNDPPRVPSPFWNQKGKKALQFDAARQQYIEVPDGPDLDRTDAVSFSLLVVNLHDPADAAYHGLVAKRGVADGKIQTNYGINFSTQTDTLQVYLSDGSGYKVTQFSTKDALPARKLTFLTATYLVGDAPGTDADTDIDDVRIQLFANGEPLKPKASPQGLIDGNSAWIVDVNPAGLANNLPLTIGRSEAAAGEYLSAVVDEFSLFPIALTPEQVKQLFLEVAGPNAPALIAQDGPGAVKGPVIVAISQPAIQIGQTATVTLSGSDLAPNPQVAVPLPNVKVDVTTSEPNRLVINVTPAADVIPGIYPLWVQTERGLSRPVSIAFDRLPQLPVPNTGAEAPVNLPGAFFGNLSGPAQPKIYFAGKKGQRIVADVELKRLGGQANPVIEIKSAQGTPVTIAWGHHSLRGDTRAEVALPRDGIYAVELHDLTYNAPGANVYRLKIGDLKLMDACWPAVVPAGQVAITPVGSGFTAAEQWAAVVHAIPESRFGLLTLPPNTHVDGTLPAVLIGQSTEALEADTADGQPQVVNATFADANALPVGINGRLQKRGERDKYLLNVTPGQKLRFTMQAQSISSPVDGEITIFQHPQGNVLAMTGEQPTLADAVLEFTVPADQKQVLVGVRDLLGRGDDRSFYRLDISPGGRPSFDLAVTSPVIDLPDNGTVAVEVQITRSGYDGPISLKVTGDPSVSVTPAQIAAGLSGKTFVRLSRQGRPAAGTIPLVRLFGESVGLQPAILQAARITGSVSAPAYAETLALGTPPASGLTLDIPMPPTQIFRGVATDIPVIVKRQPEVPAAQQALRFALVSTEAPRLRVPNNPGAGSFPLTNLVPAGLVEPGVEQAVVKLLVPGESIEPNIEVVLKAEAMAHAYTERVQGTAYSVPFRFATQPAVAPTVDAPTLAIVSEAEHKLTGQLQRTAGFTGPVDVTVIGLPGDYQVTAANVPGDQPAFAVVIKAPKVAAETPLANVKLRVTSQGSLLVAEQPIAVKAVPPAAK